MSIQPQTDLLLSLVRGIRHLRQSGNLSRPKKINYCGSEDFVLQHGRMYYKAERPAKLRRGIPRHCFANSLEIICGRSRPGRKLPRTDYIYVEGFAVSGDIPVPFHHAWLAQPGSNAAFDVTSTSLDAYIGVPFRADFVQKHWRTTSLDCISILDNYANRWKLFEMTPEEFIATGLHPEPTGDDVPEESDEDGLELTQPESGSLRLRRLQFGPPSLSGAVP